MARKKYDDDDNTTFVNMDIDGMKGHQTEEQKKNINEIRRLNLTKKEKRAIFWGSFLAVIPMMLAVIIAFAIAAGVVWLWLRQGV